jgi:hypothetical protein
MPKLKDLTGMTFGRLTVIERAGSYKNGNVTWLCKCDCGCEKVIIGRSLISGITKSCGCLMKDMATERMTTHGGHHTRLYTIWRGMKERTSNPNSQHYSYYGGRGIKVCDEWKTDFASFRDWAMAHGYRDDLSIDRIDVDGNYEPYNCRWTDQKTQLNNRKCNRLLTVNGVSQTMAEWSRVRGISYNAIRKRLRLGWPVERALGMVI